MTLSVGARARRREGSLNPHRVRTSSAREPRTCALGSIVGARGLNVPEGRSPTRRWRTALPAAVHPGGAGRVGWHGPDLSTIGSHSAAMSARLGRHDDPLRGCRGGLISNVRLAVTRTTVTAKEICAPHGSGADFATPSNERHGRPTRVGKAHMNSQHKRMRPRRGPVSEAVPRPLCATHTHSWSVYAHSYRAHVIDESCARLIEKYAARVALAARIAVLVRRAALAAKASGGDASRRHRAI